MIDPSMDTAQIATPYATIDYMQIEIDKLKKDLAQRTEDWEFVRQELATARTQVYELEDYLKANYSYMDESHAEQIAAIFNIKLEREYFVTITATFSGTVTAPIDYDMDDLENDLQATIDTHHYGNSDVYVDLSEDRMEIDWQES